MQPRIYLVEFGLKQVCLLLYMTYAVCSNKKTTNILCLSRSESHGCSIENFELSTKHATIQDSEEAWNTVPIWRDS